MTLENYSIPYMEDGKVDVKKVRHDFKNSAFFILEAKKLLDSDPKSKDASEFLARASGRLEYLRRILEDQGLNV